METQNAKIVLDNGKYYVQDTNNSTNRMEIGSNTFQIKNVTSNNIISTKIEQASLPTSLAGYAVHSFVIDPGETVGNYGKYAITIGAFTIPCSMNIDNGIIAIGTADIADIGSGGLKTIYYFADLNVDETYPEIVYIKLSAEIPDTLLVFSLCSGTTNAMKIRHEY